MYQRIPRRNISYIRNLKRGKVTISSSEYVPDHFQNLTNSHPIRSLLISRISLKSAHNFLSYSANKQTNKHMSEHYLCQPVAEVIMKHNSNVEAVNNSNFKVTQDYSDNTLH